MMIIQKVWNEYDGNYVSDDSDCCCWRKADILPVKCNAGINNNVGRATLAHNKKYQ